MKTFLRSSISAGLILMLITLTGCSAENPDRRADSADEVAQTSAASLGQDAINLGNYKDLGNRLPFGIRNDLPGTSIRISAKDDPYDFLTDGSTGRPSSSPSLGFNGAVLESGTAINAWFWPRNKTKNSPFELQFFIGNQFGTPPVSMSFDQVYHCFTSFSGQQVPCTDFFSVKQWFGWAWRSADRNSVNKQVPWVCNSTSAEFTYVNESDKTTHYGRGRLECGSTSAAALGNAIVLEEVKK